MINVVLLLAATIIVLVLVKHVLDMVALKDFPPGPPRWPIVGSLLSTPGELIHLYAEKHWKRRYGPVVGLKAGAGKNMVMVCGAEEVRVLFNHPHCQARPILGAMERSFGKRLGIMFSDGDYWTGQRRFALRELRDLGLGKSTLEGVVMDDVEATLVAIKRDGPELEPNTMFNGPVLNALWSMISGKPFAQGAGSSQDPKSRRLLDIMRRAMRNKRLGVAPCQIWPPLGRLAPELSGFNEIYPPLFEIQEYLREEMQAQRRDGVTDSFMGKYTEEISKAQPDSGFSDESLIITCMDMFLAGGESTANTLSFALMYMVLHPEVQARVHEELDAVCGNKTITMSDKPNLPLVEATLFEALRINPIAPLGIPHENSQDIQLNGYTIPKGTMFLLSIWSVLNDEKHWGDPENFRPDRFIKDGKVVKDPYMIPFGIGKRFCIGESFALQVAFLFFANLMNRFRFLLPPGKERPSTIAEAGFTVSPQHYSLIAVPRT